MVKKAQEPAKKKEPRTKKEEEMVGGFNFKKVVMLLVITSFVLSIIAILNSSVALKVASGGGVAGEQKQVSITDKYDKGKSLKKAMAKDKAIIIFFYTNWCGFCQRFVPTFDKITKDRKFKAKFETAYVNCEDPDNDRIMKEFRVEGFPTVYVVDKQGRRTHIENDILFQDDAKEAVTKKAMELIGEE